MKVISNQRSQVLAGRIAASLQCQLSDVKWSRFPDGEIYLQAQDISEEMIIVGSLITSDDLVELLLLTDACSESKITLVLPYMGYARQDKKFKAGEPLSARAIARALSAGVHSVITINLHEKTILPFFKVPAVDLTLDSAMAEEIGKLSLKSPLILAPDEGAAKLALDIATAGGWESDYLQKVRLAGDLVRIEPKTIPVAERDVVIVDDIVSTGGTQATAALMLYDQGAFAIHTVCIHGVMATGAYSRLIKAGFCGVYSSDTIESACSRYSAADTIARHIRSSL